MTLFDVATLLACLAAAAVLVLIPGPGMTWIVAQVVADGTRRARCAPHWAWKRQP